MLEMTMQLPFLSRSFACVRLLSLPLLPPFSLLKGDPTDKHKFVAILELLYPVISGQLVSPQQTFQLEACTISLIRVRFESPQHTHFSAMAE